MEDGIMSLAGLAGVHGSALVRGRDSVRGGCSPMIVEAAAWGGLLESFSACVPRASATAHIPSHAVKAVLFTGEAVHRG